MGEFFVTMFASRYFANVVLSFAVWQGIFVAVFFALSWLLGVTHVVGAPTLILLGMAQCTPFLLITMVMVRQLFKTRKAMAKIAATDMLTGLPNRRAFLDTLDKALTTDNPDGWLFLIDIDHFKRVNDTYGHAVGDACLRAYTAKITALTGSPHPVGRLGGEEFAIIFRAGELPEMRGLGQALVQGVMIGPPDVPVTLKLTCSIGVARLMPDQTSSQLLRDADTALYAAKSAGRARVIYFEDLSEMPPDHRAAVVH